VQTYLSKSEHWNAQMRNWQCAADNEVTLRVDATRCPIVLCHSRAGKL
jgi:hypothetical protein